MKFKHTNLPIEIILPKLVRDNIPQIIKDKDGNEPKVTIAHDDKAYLNYLLKKMVEESVEVQNHSDRQDLIAELADVKELTLTVMKLIGIPEDEIEKMRLLKKEKNGGFEKRYILERK